MACKLIMLTTNTEYKQFCLSTEPINKGATQKALSLSECGTRPFYVPQKTVFSELFGKVFYATLWGFSVKMAANYKVFLTLFEPGNPHEYWVFCFGIPRFYKVGNFTQHFFRKSVI